MLDNPNTKFCHELEFQLGQSLESYMAKDLTSLDFKVSSLYLIYYFESSCCYIYLFVWNYRFICLKENYF